MIFASPLDLEGLMLCRLDRSTLERAVVSLRKWVVICTLSKFYQIVMKLLFQMDLPFTANIRVKIKEEKYCQFPAVCLA
jgi:hypothetical protein